MGSNIQLSLLTVGSQGTLSDRNTDGVDDTVTFYFGDLLNLDGAPLDDNDLIVTEVTVAVMNDPINTRGKTIYTYYETVHQSYSHDADSTLTIQEPELLLDINLVNTGPFEGGDIIQFDISIYHAPTSYAASDIFLLDIMPDYLTLINATSNVGTVIEGKLFTLTVTYSIIRRFFKCHSGSPASWRCTHSHYGGTSYRSDSNKHQSNRWCRVVLFSSCL
jgi:hypothetical protein